MFWAGIMFTSKTQLKTIFMDNLLPWATLHFAGRPSILQQDWAPSPALSPFGEYWKEISLEKFLPLSMI
uniref:Uncharacterized protein n=1 Tax=Caenorhabditis japonica TaxID=281687 RepID=A0A8R1ETY6_CAEJA